MRNNKVLVLSPDPTDVMYAGRWRDILAQLAGSLERFGIGTEQAPWTSDLGAIAESAALVLPLLAWGYQRDHRRWLDTCVEWQRCGIPVQNPPEVLRWNSDKRYLEELRERGAPVVPSLYCDGLSYSRLQDSLAFFDVDTVVLKPTVSATAYKTSLWRAGTTVADPPEGPCIIQPYLPSIEREGEISLIFIEGRFSHALRKIPAEGDFRVQPEFGGRLTAHVPDQNAIQTAQQVLQCTGPSLLYARIDLVLSNTSQWLLLEAELIEPDLFLNLDGNRGELIGQALRDRMSA